MAPRVFLVTGTSTGFGYELVKVILENKDHVVATARDSSKLKFDGTTESNYLAIDLDVTSQSSIDKAFDAALKKFGRVDVVVNNAGYGLAGVFESLSEKQIRTQMEVNFFGLINVTRKALEIMREQKGGVIQQVTSIGGQVGVPTFSICAYPEKFPQHHLANVSRLCFEMGRRRVYGSRAEGIEAGMEHQTYLHRARWFPN